MIGKAHENVRCSTSKMYSQLRRQTVALMAKFIWCGGHNFGCILIFLESAQDEFHFTPKPTTVIETVCQLQKTKKGFHFQIHSAQIYLSANPEDIMWENAPSLENNWSYFRSHAVKIFGMMSLGQTGWQQCNCMVNAWSSLFSYSELVHEKFPSGSHCSSV